MSGLMLEGNVDHSATELARLREENRTLRIENSTLKAELEATRAENEVAIGSLRRCLTPLYQALQRVFGDMDAIAPVGDEPAATGSAANGNSRWDAIKQRNPGRIAEAIDALLIHGPLNVSQMAAVIHIDRSNCSKNVVGKMLRMGIAERDGQKIRLRE